MKKINLALIFGGPSVEHEVSVVTGLTVYESLDKEKYEITPIYISKNRSWYTGKSLLSLDTFKFLSADPKQFSKLTRIIATSDATQPFLIQEKDSLKPFKNIDVALLTNHGTFVEDGSLQGIFELANIPYTGPSVVSAAVGFDKVMMRDIFKAHNFPQLKYEWFLRCIWEKNPDTVIQKLEKKLTYPLFVKPSSLGSSIGVSKAKNQQELRFSINVACQFDRKIIIEKALEEAREINCTVIGFEEVETTALEEIIMTKSRQLHDYESKYLEGGGKNKKPLVRDQRRVIPADLSEEKTKEIKNLSTAVFKAIDNSGIARVDFLLDKFSKVFINEINTIPGMLSSYYWKKSGTTFTKALNKLIYSAIKRFKDKERNVTSIDSNLFESSTGLKTKKE